MNYNIDELFTDSYEPKAEVIPVVTCDDEKSLFKLDKDVPREVPILPLRGNVLFPAVIIPVNAGRKSSLRLLNTALKKDLLIGVVAQRNSADNPLRGDLNDTGTLAKVVQVLDLPGSSNSLAIVQGFKRFMLGTIRKTEPYMTGEVIDVLDETMGGLKGQYGRTMLSVLRKKFTDLMKSHQMPNDVVKPFKGIKGIRLMINFIANHLDCETLQKQEMLEISDYEQRALRVIKELDEKLAAAEVRKDIENKTNRELSRQQRDYFLRQEMQEIQRELGGTPNDRDISGLAKRAAKKKWSYDMDKFFYAELDKLRRIQPQMPEYMVQINYLNLMLDLPWNEFTKDRHNIKQARKVLDHDHFGLEKVKERILEHIAVLQLKGDMKSPILCLVGPPGTGKTSLGRSVAEALGRKYVRMALGGLHDESEIRGHRKTYVGSMPGRIIQSIKKAQSSNPVFILDEIDKVQTNTINGDPTSALLEVLDPEQNKAFHDNYLDLDYDLSNVLFIATANSLSGIQPALLDRMEIIELSGYILEEKVEIASRHLVPRQLKEHGFARGELRFSKMVLQQIVNKYTREAGVRQLDKQIAKIVRRKAVMKVNGDEVAKAVVVDELKELLGLPIHQSEVRGNDDRVGVVTGLAWTAVGGEILFVEACTSKGKGSLTMTGNLGDVMKESATLAFEYVKANAERFGVDSDLLENKNIHVHVPEGATPKDGPSAGITMFTAMISALTGRRVRSCYAMTGEITLRGSVTPVGGIKEKILAAKRACITDIALCEENRRDVEDVPQAYLDGLTFHYIKEMSDILPLVLLDKE